MDVELMAIEGILNSYRKEIAFLKLKDELLVQKLKATSYSEYYKRYHVIPRREEIRRRIDAMKEAARERCFAIIRGNVRARKELAALVLEYTELAIEYDDTGNELKKTMCEAYSWNTKEDSRTAGGRG